MARKKIIAGNWKFSCVARAFQNDCIIAEFWGRCNSAPHKSGRDRSLSRRESYRGYGSWGA